jgi:hypothetical protein
MKKALLSCICLLCVVLARAQSFSGTLDRTTLDQYLARSISMAYLIDIQQSDPAAYAQSITMLANLNARFIGRTAGLWGEEWVLNYNYTGREQQLVRDIESAYQRKGLIKPIIQGAILEKVTSSVNQVQMSAQTALAYGLPAPRAYSYERMRYTSYPTGTQVIWEDDTKIVPDMSQVETQMWFYDLATRYIDSGFEAIHFGQIDMMDNNDPNHTAWWNLLSRIRAYAASRNRGLVLCDAHTTGYYYTSPQTGTSTLLFDFHSGALRMTEDRGFVSVVGGGSILNYTNGCGGSLYGNSLGGRTYFGWTATSLPYLVEFDNYGKGARPGQRGDACFPWGWDEITWFAQSTNVYRNQWLKYAYYKASCLDAASHLEMPGLRPITTNQGLKYYRATTGAESDGNYNQEAMIGRIWAGEYDADWSASASVAEVQDNPVTLNSNTLAYISTDGRLRVAYRTNASAGPWTVVQPAQLASLAISSQVAANGALTASPDGRYLYYRGVDGEIYGYEIRDMLRDYRYFKLSTNNLTASEKVQSDLICVGNNRLYYRSVSNLVYCYIRCYCGGQEWLPTSPSWVANSTISINQQVRVAGSLLTNAAGNMLYYRGTDEYVHGYRINNDWSYDYFDLPRNLDDNERVRGQMVRMGKQIYYVGRNSRVYGLLLDAPYGADSSPAYGGKWGKISPSWSASLEPSINLQEQASAPSILAVSPDGSRLMYLGGDNALHGFRVLDDYNSEYFDITPMSYRQRPTRGLIFTANDAVAYVSNYDDNGGNRQLYTYQFGTQVPACQNPAVNIIEKIYNYSLRSSIVSQDLELAADSTPVASTAAPAAVTPAVSPAGGAHLLSVSPNPANGVLQVELSNCNTVTAQVQLTDLSGRSILTSTLLPTDTAGKVGGLLLIADVAPGVYLVVTTDALGSRQTTKVVVQH